MESLYNIVEGAGHIKNRLGYATILDLRILVKQKMIELSALIGLTHIHHNKFIWDL